MLETLRDQSLLEHISKLGNRVSYFEAAEGTAYRDETKERLAAKQEFWAAMSEAKRRGLEPDTRGFML
jgi:hypothetical protein